MIDVHTLSDVLMILGFSGLGISAILWTVVEALEKSIKRQKKMANDNNREMPKKLVKQLKKAYAQADDEQAEQIRKTMQALIGEVSGNGIDCLKAPSSR